VELIEQVVTVKVDSKGRICIPAEMRDKIGKIAVIKNTPQGILITPGKREDFIKAFNKLITSEPKRKGKPKLATPKEMKSVWRTVK
jgi:bifunctional DNA-binding transcriptional regulator/antitoxin component of YhaV-PrlF toxin-antitoxin module